MATLDFLAGGGEMGSLIRAFDWSKTPLGPPAKWPQSLKTMVRTMLTTRHPVFIFWGDESISLYNDAYRATFPPDRHPWALGRRGDEVWAEIWDVLHPQITQVLAGGEPTWFENQPLWVIRNGEKVETYWTYSYGPISDDAAPNGVGGVLVLVTETTEQLQAERRYHALNQHLEQEVRRRSQDRDRVWATSQDLLVVITKEGLMLDVNPICESMLGFKQDEMINHSCLPFLHPEDVAKTIDIMLFAADQQVSSFENRFIHKDGRMVCLSWIAAPESGLIYASGRDVSKERENAEALIRAETALRQSQKMEAVGQLTGGIAHDFNNLLTGISGSLEVMQLRITQGRPNDIERYVLAAQGAAKRAAALTHRLLAFSRRQTLDPKPANVNRIISNMYELLRRTISLDVYIEVVGAADLWTTIVDPGQLENSLLNLCINARDAMPDGGRITIETGNKWIDSRTAQSIDLAPGQYVSLCVTDTGTGMTAETIARAFDPFYTTKPIGVGTGLGLSMVYGFVRQSGGQVRIYSELGQGTTVCMYFPRHHGVAVGDEENDSMIKDIPMVETNKTVLLVDDEPVIRMLVVEMLSDAGLNVLEAGDGAEAIKILDSDARIDLLVTDVGLPGQLNGRQVADAARRVRPDLKVIFITGYAENAVIGNGHLDAGMEIVTKPFDITMLLNKVQEMVR